MPKQNRRKIIPCDTCNLEHEMLGRVMLASAILPPEDRLNQFHIAGEAFYTRFHNSSDKDFNIIYSWTRLSISDYADDRFVNR